MSCPICSHTMEGLDTPGRRLFWCPRCGTLRELTGADPNESVAPFSRMSVPSLVGRVRQFREMIGNGRGLAASDAELWHRLGITEAILRPEERPA